MRTMQEVTKVRSRVLAGVALALGVALATAAGAVEIIPAVGLTRAVDGGADAKVFGSLALRGPVLPPFLEAELGVAYRDEDRFDDQLKLRMWPVTASLLVKPIPMLYGEAGVGWYMTTFDWDSSVPIEDETKQEFGVHVGGGLRMPIAPVAAIDFNGRYVMMRDQDARLVPEKFDPDFWMTSVGLALHF